MNPKDHLYVDKAGRVQSKYLWTDGTSYAITKVGHDTNGNWSYWLRPFDRKRAIKIQHMAMAGGGHHRKLTVSGLMHVHQTKNKDVLATIAEVIAYYNRHHSKK